MRIFYIYIYILYYDYNMTYGHIFLRVYEIVRFIDEKIKWYAAALGQSRAVYLSNSFFYEMAASWPAEKSY